MKLFSRYPGTSNYRDIARAAAHRVLDLAVKGDKTAQERIGWALRVTGDRAPVLLPPNSPHYCHHRDQPARAPAHLGAA